MSPTHDYGFGAVGGPGQSGAAPGAATGSQTATAPDAPRETAGGEAEESVTAPCAEDGLSAEASPGSAATPPAGAEQSDTVVGPASQHAGEAEQSDTVVGPASQHAGASDSTARSDAEVESYEHEARLERDLEELTAKAEKADQYLELAQRTKADFENYRKRAAREAAAAQERGMVKLARELLPAVDNLDRALAAARTAVPAQDGQPVDDESATLVSGIKLVHADVIAALARVGIEPFSPEGEPFDPQWHEAIAQQPIEGAEPGTVVEVYQRGFRLGDSVLRPARVVVAG